MKNRRVVIGVVVAVIFILLSRCGGSDDSISSRGKANKISLKGGVMAIVPELRMDMTFNEIPDGWLNNVTHEEDYIFIDDRLSEFKNIKYDDIPFTVYFWVAEKNNAIFKENIDSTLIIKNIVCESKEKIDSKQANEILKAFKSQYGKPIDTGMDNYFYWEEGDYCITLLYESKELKITMSRDKDPFVNRN